jgi:hypothetical protein
MRWTSQQLYQIFPFFILKPCGCKKLGICGMYFNNQINIKISIEVLFLKMWGNGKNNDKGNGGL